MRLILVRHGETPANRHGVIQGQQETELSAVGRQQAEDIANYLREIPLRVVFTSDLRRSRDTTERIVEYHGGVERHTRRELRERSMGVFEGRAVSEFEAAVKSQSLGFHEYRPPGGESLLDVEARVRLVWRSIWDQYRDQIVLISAHNGPNIALLRMLLDYSFEQARSIQQDNGCINIVDLSLEGSVVHRELNVTDHLTTRTANRMGGLSG